MLMLSDLKYNINFNTSVLRALFNLSVNVHVPVNNTLLPNQELSVL